MSRAVRYHVVNKIAHGGMAEIFLALQLGAEGFQKQVVLKRILPALAADPAFVRMLVDEAHIASTLNHSNLVQVLDLGRSGDECVGQRKRKTGEAHQGLRALTDM